MDPALARAFETTWPAAEYAQAGGFRVGHGLGAGGRVGSAFTIGNWMPTDIDAAINIHFNWKQRALFSTLDTETKLQDELETRNFLIEKPSLIMAAPTKVLTDQVIPKIMTFTIWPPLSIQRDIWVEGNIDARRQAIMDRVTTFKTSILGRIEDRAAGTAFAALNQDVAMLHALEIAPEFRRKGLAGWMIRQAAFWAEENGASRLALAVLRDNAGAVSLYESLGFRVVTGYRYYAKDI